MPALVEAESAQAAVQSSDPQYTVTQQEVELNVDFRSRQLVGRATITIEPETKDLKSVSLGCRAIEVKKITVDNVSVKVPSFRDPYAGLTVRQGYGVHQHHQMRENIDDAVQADPEPNLILQFPKTVRVRELNTNEVINGRSKHLDGAVEAALVHNLEEGEGLFEPITIVVDYVVKCTRDSLQWVGLEEGDSRYPHVFTCASSVPASFSCFVFPYLDSPSAKYSWKFAIRCPRTLGDLTVDPIARKHNGGLENGDNVHNDRDAMDIDVGTEPPIRALTHEEKARDLVVVGCGVLEESDAPCEDGDHFRQWIFSCQVPVTPAHVGFAIGPFEEVDFSDCRETGKEDQLKDHAVTVRGFCLPGRTDELRNTCIPLQMAVDSFMQSYISYPFAPDCQTYRMCFVDDLAMDVIDTATLSLCSSRLLFPETILDNIWEYSRILLRAAASQWIGVFITAKENVDYWIVVGGSYFMAENFMATLWGRNELRYRQKLAADVVKAKDRGMPSIVEAGNAVSLDPAELEFLELKAPLVLYLLHQRLLKLSSAVGVVRVLSRMLSDARSSRLKNNEIWTERFIYTTEKVAHHKVQTFFEQWVKGSGCPSFLVSQQFQKKKFSVAISIKQTQKHEVQPFQQVRAEDLIREVKEAENDVYAPPLQESFIGPMTIRVHEPSGLPYEQIVEIRDIETKIEFHYNSKNKNQLRKRRQRQREAAAEGRGHIAEDGDDFVPTYSLGDVLTSADDMAAWRLVGLDQNQEAILEGSSYEWIRVDKDFEWIANITFHSGTQPGELELMYILQLQGDNDVVAHLEAIERLRAINPTRLLSTVFVRTLMDERYFYGVRVKAAEALVSCAVSDLDYVGLFHLQKAFQTLFCFDGSPMTVPNDFTDMRLYQLRCAIVKALAAIRDASGKAPSEVKQFFLDKLKFNDNTSNEYSDSFYVGYLIAGLTNTLLSSYNGFNFSFDNDILAESVEERLKREALAEIERMRRIDEWIPSYRNVHTRAALRGLSDLMALRIIPKRSVSFLPYTRPGNFDEVRLEAFGHLIQLGMMANDSFLRYVFSSLATDRSAYFRDRLWRRIKRGLASIAMGETDMNNGVEMRQNEDGLAIDEGETMASRSKAIERSTMEGAMRWLKLSLQSNKALQEAIMDALRSPIIGLKDFVELLDICNYLFDPVDHLPVAIPYPRYWAAQHEGDAKLRFFKKNKYRLKPMPRDLKRKKGPEDQAKSPEAKRPRPDVPAPKIFIRTNTNMQNAQNTLPSPGPSQPATVHSPKPQTPVVSHVAKPKATQPKVVQDLRKPMISVPKKQSSPTTTKTSSLDKSRLSPGKFGKSKCVVLKFVQKKAAFSALVSRWPSTPQTSTVPDIKRIAHISHTNGSVIKPEPTTERPLANIPISSAKSQKPPGTNIERPKPTLKLKFTTKPNPSVTKEDVK